MSRKHVCIFHRKCWCGADPHGAKEVHRRTLCAGVGGKAGWPRDSDAMGVHPSQVDDARRESVLLGVPTDFKKNGCAIVRDQSHQRKLTKALGLRDRSGFMG